MNKAPNRYKNSVIPHAMVKGASEAIEFYKKVFDATELFRLTMPNGHIIHAESRLEDSVFMVGEAAEPFEAPSQEKPSTVGLHVYVNDVDAFTERAVNVGAILLQPAQDMFYGDRQTMLRDPFGHLWVILTHQEKLAEDEIVQRAEQFFSHMSA